MSALTNSMPTQPSATPCDTLQAQCLDPLSEFFDVEGWHVVERESTAGSPLPEPARGLLVHDRDMTSTLEAFHGAPIGLEVLGRRHDGDHLLRHVLLFAGDRDRIVEYGAIRIALDAFPDAARQAVLGGQTPLGAILSMFEIPYLSRPRHFFSFSPDHTLCQLLGLETCRDLHGRRNLLTTADGRTLAEVVEILPPADLSIG